MPSASVLRVLTLIGLHRQGKLTDEWNQVPIEPSEYLELLRYLRQQDEDLRGYVRNKIHYDYSPGDHWVAIRMTTITHSLITRELAHSISSQLQVIIGEVPKSLAQVIRGIRDQGHGRMFLWRGNPNQDRRKVGMHCPDGAFRHLRANYPRVIIEISFSQRKKELEYLADTYIVDSLGEVKVIIGIDLEYGNTKRSRVIIWRPKVVKTETGEQFLESEQTFAEDFRNEFGQAIPGKLSLQLGDFLLPNHIAEQDRPYAHKQIEISFLTLSSYFTDGQDLEKLSFSQTGDTEDEERELVFRKDIQRARGLGEEADPDFRGKKGGVEKSDRQLRGKKTPKYSEDRRLRSLELVWNDRNGNGTPGKGIGGCGDRTRDPL